MVQLGPGMYTQTQQECATCQGKGKVIDKATTCKGCQGQQIKLVHEITDVVVPVGFPNRDKVVIQGKGNEHPDYKAGDLVVIITIKPNAQFTRVNNDLLITQKVGLIEALSGFSFNLKHINDLEIQINSPPGQILQHK